MACVKKLSLDLHQNPAGSAQALLPGVSSSKNDFFPPRLPQLLATLLGFACNCGSQLHQQPQEVGDIFNGWISTCFIEPASPWQNGVNESFNGRFRDECLIAVG